MFTSLKTKLSKIMAFVLAVLMIIGMIPASLMTVFAATTAHPDVVTVTVVDNVTGEPIEGAKVTYTIYDNELGEEVMGNEDMPTDANGEAVVLDTEPGDVKISSITVTHDDYATYTNAAYNQEIVSIQDNFVIEMTCVKIKGVTVTPNDLTFNGEAQSAVTVEGLQQEDVVTYTINGEPSVDGKVTNADTYSVVVGVERENFDALEVPVEVTVKPADLDFDISPITGLKYNEQEQTLVELSGSFQETDAVTWTVNDVETNSSEIPKADAIGNYKVKLTVIRSNNFNKFEKEVTVGIDTGVLNIDNLEVKANDRTYDSTTKDALSVLNQGNYDLEYKLGENGTWEKNVIPQITDAGTYKVYVRATKTGYHNADYPTYPISVTISQAKIVGVTATGYSAKYDKQTHDAITEVKGFLPGDTVTYSKTEGGEYASTVPTVKKVKDSGTYYVKVYRNDNFETLIIRVTVSITKNDQQTIAFGNVPQEITYNANNTLPYAIETKSEPESEGKITYSIVGGTADATIDENTGTVTYTSVGTVEVQAHIAECDNFVEAYAKYTVTISYATFPEKIVITHEDVTVNGYKWYKGDVVIYAEGANIIKGTNAVNAEGWETSITETEEKEYSDYKVAFKKANGDITDLYAIPLFAIDKTAPTEKNAIYVEFKDKYDDPVSKVIHLLTFGLFCNEEVEVTVICDDEAAIQGSPNAGVASIELFKYDIQGNPTPVEPDDENVSNVFTLPIGFEGTIKVKVTDKVGNTIGEQLITKDNSNMENVNGYVMIEEDAPFVSELVDAAINEARRDEGTHHYSGDVKVSFRAKDEGAGLYSVSVKLNGVDYPVTPAAFGSQDRSEHNYELSTVGKNPDENGKYKFDVTVVDNAGNVTEKTLTVEKDLTSPIITGFDFAVEAGKVDVQEVVSIEYYGYYFNEEVTVTVSAKDDKLNVGDCEMVSGVEKITVVLVDKDGKYYTINQQKEIVEISDVSGAQANDVTDNALKFKMTKDFKGQIYAFATDNVGNMPTNSKFDFGTPDDNIVDDGKLKGFKYPEGSVLESQTKHDNADYDHIVFEKDNATFMANDDSDNELYAGDVDVKLTVTDNYSGIAKIEWSVEAPYDTVNNQEGVITVANNESASKNEMIGNSGWKVINKDKNLVTQVEKTITVSNDSNDILVWVKLTDRAGNTTSDSIQFNIDKQAPIITVEMNDSDDEEYSGFFKEDRAYKVTILERNFIKDVKFEVAVTDDKDTTSAVTITPDFKVVIDGDKPQTTVIDGIEYYTYEWDSKFTTDGDYTFSISAVDLADNETVDADVSYVNGEDADIRSICNAFTVDQTLPIISVSYDNNTAANEKYFNRSRTATVVVKEHNFDVERVDFTALTAFLDGNEINKPEIKWTHEGDIHTATIAFAADGDYTFDVKMTDKAANESTPADFGSSVAGKDFVIDQTAPVLDITGVADKSANNGDVAPIITYSDVNFDKDAVSIVLSGINNGVVDYKGSYMDATHGQTFTYVNFEEIQKVDDIYTLTAKLTDKAGNSTEKTITFSANRFGSVYDLTDVEDIKGKYLQKEQDIVFTETNVDSLDREGIKLKLTKNGTPKDLEEGTDYTIDISGGNGQWSVYKYIVKKSLFESDGRYSLTVYSKDGAGNVNENIDETKKAEISFGIDKTKPVVVPIDFESGVQYAVEEKVVSIEIKDNLVLQGVKIYLNDEEVEYTVEGETYTFKIPAGNSKQDVKVIATDAAGNEYELPVNGFLVSTNLFVRWYNNTPLFVGSIIGVVCLGVAITAVILFGKKKKEGN